MSVHSLLITGPDDCLELFHKTSCFVLLAQERRGQTVAYTCMDDDFAFAIESALVADVTVQEITGAGEAETYETRLTGSHGMKWERKSPLVAKTV